MEKTVYKFIIMRFKYYFYNINYADVLSLLSTMIAASIISNEFIHSVVIDSSSRFNDFIKLHSRGVRFFQCLTINSSIYYDI